MIDQCSSQRVPAVLKQPRFGGEDVRRLAAVDATLTWTVVGSAAGVAGVAVAAVAFVMQARSERKHGPKVTSELGIGQLDDQDGVLYVEFVTGKTNVMTLPKPGKARASTKKGSAKWSRTGSNSVRSTRFSSATRAGRASWCPAVITYPTLGA